MEQIALQWEPERRIYTVGELTTSIRAMLTGEFAGVWVAGEISGVKLAASGHYYFSLKDQQSQVRCACFRMTARYLKCKPQDGMSVLVRGSVDVYEARGEYQLLVEAIEPQGLGALQAAFEQLKKKLAAEGLFDAARKRPLPKLPRRIGIVTSPTGAVIQDMLQILERRFPGLHIRVYPALVQGEGSIEAVCRGIEYFGQADWAEVLIVARGGGSLEDLWTFNEEAVARAIAACAIPVISAIGHETDFTIADFVADLRAPTPSAAAELVICSREQVLDQIEGSRHKMLQLVRLGFAHAGRRLHQQGIDRVTTVLHRAIGRYGQRTDELEYALRDRLRAEMGSKQRSLLALDERIRATDLRLKFASARRRLEASGTALEQSIRHRLSETRTRLSSQEAHLTQLSPLRILERGYAIVENERGEIVKAPAEAPAGSRIQVRLASGSLRAKVIRGGSSELPS